MATPDPSKKDDAKTPGFFRGLFGSTIKSVVKGKDANTAKEPESSTIDAANELEENSNNNSFQMGESPQLRPRKVNFAPSPFNSNGLNNFQKSTLRQRTEATPKKVAFNSEGSIPSPWKVPPTAQLNIAHDQRLLGQLQREFINNDDVAEDRSNGALTASRGVVRNVNYMAEGLFYTRKDKNRQKNWEPIRAILSQSPECVVMPQQNSSDITIKERVELNASILRTTQMITKKRTIDDTATPNKRRKTSNSTTFAATESNFKALDTNTTTKKSQFTSVTSRSQFTVPFDKVKYRTEAVRNSSKKRHGGTRFNVGDDKHENYNYDLDEMPWYDDVEDDDTDSVENNNKDVSSAGEEKVTKSNDESKPWTCSKCSTKNASDEGNCKKCGARVSVPTTLGWGSNMFNTNAWKCNVCSSQNDMKLDTCASCTTPRSSKTSLDTMSSSKPASSFPASQPTGVQLPNNAARLNFGVNSDQSQGETTTSTSNSAPKFSFGLASSSATTSEATSKQSVSSHDNNKFSTGNSSGQFNFGYSGAKPLQTTFSFGKQDSRSDTTEQFQGAEVKSSTESNSSKTAFSFGKMDQPTDATTSSVAPVTTMFKFSSTTTANGDNGDMGNSSINSKRGRTDESNSASNKQTLSSGQKSINTENDSTTRPVSTFDFQSNSNPRASGGFQFGSTITEKKDDLATQAPVGFQFGSTKPEVGFQFGSKTSDESSAIVPASDNIDKSDAHQQPISSRQSAPSFEFGKSNNNTTGGFTFGSEIDPSRSNPVSGTSGFPSFGTTSESTSAQQPASNTMFGNASSTFSASNTDKLNSTSQHGNQGNAVNFATDTVPPFGASQSSFPTSNNVSANQPNFSNGNTGSQMPLFGATNPSSTTTPAPAFTIVSQVSGASQDKFSTPGFTNNSTPAISQIASQSSAPFGGSTGTETSGFGQTPSVTSAFNPNAFGGPSSSGATTFGQPQPSFGQPHINNPSVGAFGQNQTPGGSTFGGSQPLTPASGTFPHTQPLSSFAQQAPSFGQQTPSASTAFGAGQSNGNDNGGGFSLGTSGKKTRRVIRAKRPSGTRQA